MDLVAWPSDSAVLSAPCRAGLAAAVRFHAEHGRLRVPTDYEDAYGLRLRSFITGYRLRSFITGYRLRSFITGYRLRSFITGYRLRS
ncbi:hypothetical protein, partial [Streptomyces sp. NPDC007070]|uniref:hypothetical protein n=1 Tax=Streptomyces sp. NPDC007070 TaxID=3154312 RepID=UPI0033C39F5D